MNDALALCLKIKTTRDQVNLVLVYTKNTINAKCTYFDLIKNKKFKGAAAHRKYRRPRSRPHLIDNIFGARINNLQAFSTKRSLKNTIGRLDLPKMKR